ncbi:MAG: L-type lectin-domain containing protein, partial [Bacteroidia bacterium]|nr:L-type lectin-domain containing protein [Bacteroidia bacterium]
MKRVYFLFFVLAVSLVPLRAQFTPLGTATQTSNTCFSLTANQPSQLGAIWQTQQIDLTRPFDLFATFFFGCADGGADGIVFVLDNQATALGVGGGGMGYQTIASSLGIEFDTWQNTNLGDPAYDHLAIVSNGINNHSTASNLAGPVGILANNGNVETCSFYNIRISWEPATNLLRVWVNCALRLSYTGNIANTIFGGNPLVHWGFVSSTGAAANLHQVCISYFNNYAPQQICYPATVQLNAGASTGTAFSWTPTAGVSNPTIANPIISPDTTTTYTVTVTSACTGNRTRSWDVTVGYDSVLNI